MSVPLAVQQAVRERARGRCEYCHSPEWVCAARFTLDHLLPCSLGARMPPRIWRWRVVDAMNTVTTLPPAQIRLLNRKSHCFTRCRMCGPSTLHGHQRGNGSLAQPPKAEPPSSGWISTTSVTTMASSECLVPCGCKEVGTHLYLIQSSRRPWCSSTEADHKRWPRLLLETQKHL
jgi:hypothetical protein